MLYFKHVVIGFVLILCSQNCFAQDWVMLQSSGTGDLPRDIYLDRDSINFHNESLYYNIKLITFAYYDGRGRNVVAFFTIQSKGDKAGVVESFKQENYKIHEKALTEKTATQLKPLTKESFLYRTNKRAWEIYSNNTDSQTQGEKPSIDEAKVDFEPYMKDLQRHIKNNWDPPRGEESKRVVLLFSVDKQGNFLNVKVKQSSGSKSADEAAITAVQKATPFKPLPMEFTGDSVDIQFTFDYNVFGMNGRNP